MNIRYLMLLIARAKNKEIENFSDEEIDRVFKNTAHETKNIKNFKELIKIGLNIQDIKNYNEQKIFQKSIFIKLRRLKCTD